LGRKIAPRISVTKGREWTMIHPYWLAPGLSGSALTREASTRVTPKTILVVEDDRAIARLIEDYLLKGGFQVTIASDGQLANELLETKTPDLIVLDLGLPNQDGLDLMRAIRRTSSLPIVVVTARGDETDRIIGLELGADDYVVKPFSPRELVARVRAVLRRTETTVELDEVIRVGNLTLDLTRMRVQIGNAPIELTPTEFQLLATMARRPGRVFTRSQLLDAVHGIAFEGYERAIDAHIKNIRKKLEQPGQTEKLIQTVYGVGYRFTES
jgi:DNA-binding response OmpR family regulator